MQDWNEITMMNADALRKRMRILAALDIIFRRKNGYAFIIMKINFSQVWHGETSITAQVIICMSCLRTQAR